MGNRSIEDGQADVGLEHGQIGDGMADVGLVDEQV